MSSPRELVFPDAVEEGADLFDRDRQVDQLREALRRPARRTVVLLGGRLVGKTSLLNVVTQWAEAEASYRVVRLAHAGSRDEFMAEIVHGIHERVGADRTLTRALFGRDRTFRTGTVARFVRVVQELAARAGQARFLLCVDELDSFLRGCPDETARQVLDLVLYLTEHAKLPIRFLFTMSRIPEQVRHSYGSPFLNQATIVELRPWSAGRSRAFVDWLLDGRRQLDDAGHAALYAAAGGHPYFTKAVLRALLDARPASAPGDPLPVAAVTAAAAAAVRSREVDIALSNIAGAYLPEGAVAVLDRVAGAPSGVAASGLRDLPATDQVLDPLLEAGLLDRQDRRYLLRLGLWRLWRDTRGGAGSGTGWRWLARLLRWPRRRVVKVAVVAGLAGLLLALAAGPVLLFPERDEPFTPCGTASGLRLTVTHPSYVSVGDQHELRVEVRNQSSQPAPISGSVVVDFRLPDGDVRVAGSNGLEFQLQPTEQRTLQVGFTPTQSGRLLPDTGAQVAVRLVVTAAGTACSGPRLSVPVAPVPYLRKLQGGALALVFLPLATMVIESLVRRLAGHRRWAGDRDRPAPQDPAAGGR